MMKCAIITYHRAENYGSALQTYALNKYLRNNGCDAETIDYCNTRQQEIYALNQKISGVMDVARSLQTKLYHKKLALRKSRFSNFLRTYVPMSIPVNKEEEFESLNHCYDVFITGSDQVWNTNCYDFTSRYLLDFVTDKSRCFSYAASIGVDRLPSDGEQLLKKWLPQFNLLSVREKRSCQYLGELIHREIVNVLDPVFLLPKCEWEQIAISPRKNKKYILCYFIGDTEGMRKFAKGLAAKTKLPLVMLLMNLREMTYSCKKAYEAGPQEFLGYFMNAEYVVTNSFHAVAFSSIFQKRFWAFVNDNDPDKPIGRILNIAHLLGLENRVLNAETCVRVRGDEEIDWTEATKKMEIQKKASEKFILEVMQRAKKNANNR